MDSIDTRLTADEKIIYRARCHWSILFGPFLVMIIGILALKSQGLHAVALTAFGLIWGIFSYLSLNHFEIGLTGNRILINVCFPLKKSYDIPLQTITGVDFYQPSLGSMLNFGKIIIIYNGKKRSIFRFVSYPAEFVGAVHRQISAIRASSQENI